MIPEDRYNQFSFGTMKPVGITIHNTHNDKSAYENYEYMLGSSYSYSCHFFIDENETIQCLPVTRTAYHTGHAFDKGNMNTIAIEICRSTLYDGSYEKAQKKAIDLIKALQKEYNIPNSSVYFHNDFDKRKYCPHRILDDYGDRQNFIEKELNAQNTTCTESADTNVQKELNARNVQKEKELI